VTRAPRRAAAWAAAGALSLSAALAHADDAPAASDEPRARFTMKATALATYRRLFDVGMLGPELDVGFGAAFRRSGSVSFEARAFAGATDGGLAVRDVACAFLWETRGPVRFAIGPTYGFLAIRRVSRDAWMSTLRMGATSALSVDLLRSGVHALGAGARFDLTVLPVALAWGPSLGIYARY
jgi:hypothetical protein